jgi:pimeloyl-ACP methyl ester carboxylesterase
MPTFERRALRINGVETTVLTAGSGPPLVYLHGAGTATRFNFAAAWARSFRVIIPYHPGFGESADAPDFTEIHDYVFHYLELFGALDLGRVRLAGQSMGGFIAAAFAAEHGYCVEKLALVCPIGIPIPEHATVNFLQVPPQELPALLAADPQTVIKHLPAAPDAAFIAERTKEAATATRVLGELLYEHNLARRLHRLSRPTLLVWGKSDRLTPTAQHLAWAPLLPNVTVRLFDNAGHLVLDEAPESVAAIAEFFGGS